MGDGYRLTGLPPVFHIFHRSGKRGEHAEDGFVMATFPGQYLTREPVPASLIDVTHPADI